MAGIFPNTGVTAPNTQNAELNAEMKSGCEDLYFPANCNPRFNPLVMNAVISELVNAINTGQDYDCSKLNNLATVLNGIKNICGYETKEADANDYLAGCFDGATGKVSVTQLAEVIQTIIGPCALPVAKSPDLNDTITMCVDGVPSQVPVTNFQELFPDAETNICALPTVTAIGQNDYVGVCVDGKSAKISVEDLRAYLTPPLTFFRDVGATSLPVSDEQTTNVDLLDMVYPRILEVYCGSAVGVEVYGASLTFTVEDNGSGSSQFASDAVTQAGASYSQFYTYVPSLGAIYRMVGTHLVRRVITAKMISQNVEISTDPNNSAEHPGRIINASTSSISVISSMT